MNEKITCLQTHEQIDWDESNMTIKENTNYKKEIITVLSTQMVVLGYIARRSILFGCSQDFPDDWCAAEDLIKPEWKTGFATRALAKQYLTKLKEW